jgi:hypothetical protein
MSILTKEIKPYNRIHHISGIRRLPRLGKIRLGIKKKTANGKEYPAEVDYFVCPPEVQKFYGTQPKLLDVMFPIDDPTTVFPQALKWYTSSSLKCKGDGVTAMRRVKDLTPEQKAKLKDELPDDPESLVEVDCPCPLLEQGQCSQKGNLLVMLPRVSMGGVYQIDTGSYHNIVRINSALDYLRGLAGRIALVPLVLKRMPEKIEYEGHRATHYLLSLEFTGNIEEVKKLREDTNHVLDRIQTLALPAPVEDNPEPPTIPTVEPEEEPNNRDKKQAPDQQDKKQELPKQEPYKQETPPVFDPMLTKDQERAIVSLAKMLKWDSTRILEEMRKFGVEEFSDFTMASAGKFIDHLNHLRNGKAETNKERV